MFEHMLGYSNHLRLYGEETGFRGETLGKQQMIAAAELDQNRADAASAAATARADSAALVAARLDLANATVRAPIGGKSGSNSE